MRRKHPFYWVAAAFGLLAGVLFVFVAITAFSQATISKADGWEAEPSGSDWIVSYVDADGPAADKLRPGDRILALDGDERIGRIGPQWVLPSRPPGATYELTLQRGPDTLTERLALANRIDTAFRTWVIIHLFVALVCIVLAMVFGMARPAARTPQYGFAACALFGAFMLWQAMRPSDGVLQDTPLALALASSVPLYMIFFYLFMARFRTTLPGGQVWRLVTWTIVGFGLLLWGARTFNNVLMAFDTSTTVQLVDRYYSLVQIHPRFLQPLEALYVAFTGIASCAAQIRNYRQLSSVDERRRIHWLIAGLIAGMAPLAIVGPLDALVRAMGWTDQLAGMLTTGKKIGNVTVVLIPLAMGYAILRHRVLGARVALRMGLQYLLAKNLLRLALILPAVWIVVRALSNPEATIGQALGDAARPLNLVLLGLVVAGLLFRTRLLRAVDRRFFREDYGRELLLRRLSESLRTSSSLADVLAFAGSEIESALHVVRVFTFDRRDDRLVAGFTSGASGALSAIPSESVLHHELNALGRTASPEDLRASGSVHAADWMLVLGIALAIPILDGEDRLVGLILLGAKRSEEPYSETDLEFLRTVALQIGTAHEVISLRERADHERSARRRVMTRLEGEGFKFIRECPDCGRCYDHGVNACETDGSELVIETPIVRTLDGKYRLDLLLGSGGMGAVYRAEDLRLNRDVAVKVVIDSFYGKGSASRRFLREARASAKLEHPNITRLYDYAVIPDTGAYLVLEYHAGSTLHRELERVGRFDVAGAAGIIEQLVAGMTAAHAAGILHRDLKPANIMLSQSNGGEQRLKILDFGLAKVRDEVFADPKSHTLAGVALGTLGYMSPEQYQGETVDERTDVYSIGVIVLELLTGKLHHRAASFHADTHRLLLERLDGARCGPAQRRVVDVLSRALATDRGERIPSVDSLGSELVPALRACDSLSLGSTTTAEPGDLSSTLGHDPDGDTRTRDDRGGA